MNMDRRCFLTGMAKAGACAVGGVAAASLLGSADWLEIRSWSLKSSRSSLET